MPRPPLPNNNATCMVREEYDYWVASNNKAIAYMFVTISDVLRANSKAKEIQWKYSILCKKCSGRKMSKHV